MPPGLGSRARALERVWSPDRRYVDAAIQLCVCESAPGTRLGWGPTGEPGPVYGGVWDQRVGEYTGEAPERVRKRPVTREQFRYVTSGKYRITGKGGRGGGKTEALAQRIERLVLERPRDSGLVLSPDFPHTQIVEEALRPRLWDLLLPGNLGVNKQEHCWRTIFGTWIKFVSAVHPEKLRGWGAGWLAVDEESIVPDSAIENLSLCLRKSADPLIFGAGTPVLGAYFDRYTRLKADPDLCEVFAFPSYDNCFVSKAAFDKAVSQMDANRYRQEVLAEFVLLEPGAVVAKGFDRSKHKIDVDELLRARALRDITGEYTARLGHRPARFIAGVDYNKRHPCIAWVYQIHARDDAPTNLWVVVDRVAAPDPATKLAHELIQRGYRPENTIVVDDASSEYDAVKGRQSPNSSARLMASLGFRTLHPAKNPPVGDRVNAFLAKLNPARGAPSWGYSQNVAEWVEPVMEGLVWDESETKPSKKEGLDHDFDAATYPIVYFEPAAELEIARVQALPW